MAATQTPIPEHTRAVLTTDLPGHGFKAGDVGVVVDVHQHGAGYEIEFMTLSGETIDVVTVTAQQVRPVTKNDMPTTRRLAG